MPLSSLRFASSWWGYLCGFMVLASVSRQVLPSQSTLVFSRVGLRAAATLQRCLPQSLVVHAQSVSYHVRYFGLQLTHGKPSCWLKRWTGDRRLYILRQLAMQPSSPRVAHWLQ